MISVGKLRNYQLQAVGRNPNSFVTYKHNMSINRAKWQTIFFLGMLKLKSSYGLFVVNPHCQQCKTGTEPCHVRATLLCDKLAINIENTRLCNNL